MRTTVARLFYFLLFVKKILFVHVAIVPQVRVGKDGRQLVFFFHSALLSPFRQLTQVTKTVDTRLMSVAPAKI